MNENEMPVNGWIKLSRGIRQNWVWNNPNWLKWWLDLLLLAAWEDTVIRKRRRRVLVRRGEVVMSERELQQRWGIRGRSTVQDFISLLVEDEMITKSYRQAGGHFCVHNDVRKGGHNDVRNDSRKSGHKSGQTNGHKGGHFFTVLTICNYDSFQSVARGAAATFTTTSESTSESTNRATNGATSTSTNRSTSASTNPARINKEIKNKRRLDVVDAREDEKVEIFDENSFWNEILSEGTNPLLESACAEMKITLAEARELSGQIVREWAARKKMHSDREDAVKHLFAQMRIKVTDERRRQSVNAREEARARAQAQSEAAMRAAMGGGVRAAAPDDEEADGSPLLRRPPRPASEDEDEGGMPGADELERKWQGVVDITADPYDDYDELS